MTVEFKREIPGRDGRSDSWLSGGKVEDYGRIKLFKEIVALANTAGGHLIIGIDEDASTSPPTASVIRPIPRCAELAERLIQSAQSIDPPIPHLIARGIPIEDEAGIVLIRVPPSRFAPHRSIDKECYARRGTSSMSISMREVRDMVLAVDRGGQAVAELFLSASAKFREWLASPLQDNIQNSQVPQPSGYRVTAVPIGGSFELQRLFGRWSETMLPNSYPLSNNGTALAPHRPMVTRAMLRGVEMRNNDVGNTHYVTVQTNGVVSSAFRTSHRVGPHPVIIMSWVLGSMLNVLHLVNKCRAEAAIPECEYAIEAEIASTFPGPLEFRAWGVGYNDHLGNLEPERLPLIFPRLSYGPQRETGNVISRFADDFYDAVESYHLEPFDLHVVEPKQI